MQERINSLRAIRAIAFMGIFLQHCGVLYLGACGVSVFIVLSGFLMTYKYYGKMLLLKESFRFAITKLKKLYPLHIIMTIATLLFLCMISGGGN